MKKSYNLLKRTSKTLVNSLQYTFRESDTVGYQITLRIVWNITDALGQTLGPNLITKLSVDFVSHQCFSVSIFVFDKKANICCSTGSISIPISSRHHNTTNQAIAVERHQSYFKNLDDFFTGKQQTTVTQLLFTCSKLTIETLEQSMKYVQS